MGLTNRADWEAELPLPVSKYTGMWAELIWEVLKLRARRAKEAYFSSGMSVTRESPIASLTWNSLARLKMRLVEMSLSLMAAMICCCLWDRAKSVPSSPSA